MARLVLNLDSKAALQESVAGGKGASLAWMRRNGFRVPDAFVVTAPAFTDLLDKLRLTELAEGRDWKGEELTRARERIAEALVPPAVANRIVRAFGRLGGPVAVRSSMIGEDSEATSFAGQLDTVLNVTEEDELLAAVRRCWASPFNWRVHAYRRERGASSAQAAHDRVSTAVVVQRMVDALAAGVAFSADPI